MSRAAGARPGTMHAMRARRFKIVGASAGIVLLAAGLFLFLTQRRESFPIAAVEQVDGATLLVEGHCGGDSDVAVRETTGEVRLRHTAARWGDGPHLLCLVHVPANLGQPLGDRPVVDETSGQMVQVRQQHDR